MIILPGKKRRVRTRELSVFIEVLLSKWVHEILPGPNEVSVLEKCSYINIEYFFSKSVPEHFAAGTKNEVSVLKRCFFLSKLVAQVFAGTKRSVRNRRCSLYRCVRMSV